MIEQVRMMVGVARCRLHEGSELAGGGGRAAPSVPFPSMSVPGWIQCCGPILLALLYGWHFGLFKEQLDAQDMISVV